MTAFFKLVPFLIAPNNADLPPEDGGGETGDAGGTGAGGAIGGGGGATEEGVGGTCAVFSCVAEAPLGRFISFSFGDGITEDLDLFNVAFLVVMGWPFVMDFNKLFMSLDKLIGEKL